jgi:hypothetical protein
MAQTWEVCMPKPTRLRPHVGITVHPDTIDRWDALCERFRLPRGQVVDKLVIAAHRMIEQNKMFCVSGELCRMGRTDVPEIL